MSKLHFQTDAFENDSVRSIAVAKARHDIERRRKPRILMVGMHLSKTRGGITTLTASILDSKLAENYDITYIASQAEDLGKIQKFGLAITAAARFAAACIWKRPEIVYVHVGSNASLYRESAFILLARFLWLNLIAHFHAGDIGTYLPRQPLPGRVFIRWALSCSHKVIAVSRDSYEYLRTMLPCGEIALLPNVIDMKWLGKPPAHATGEIKDKTIRLLFVGAVGKLKGEKDLIEALALLQKPGVDVKASFLGYGADGLAKACNEAGISEMIEHLGPVRMDERAEFYRRADIFVLPTYAEAMPISVMEAMAAGLPVISTAVGGIPEIITDGEEGILLPCGDAQALAENIALLASDPEKRMRMGKLAKKRVTEQMDFEKYIDDLGCEITSVAGGDQK